MIEKVARATYNKFMEGVEDLEPSWDELPEDHQFRLKEAAKAAIEAMREPTEEMIEPFKSTASNEYILRCWSDMIDAALKE